MSRVRDARRFLHCSREKEGRVSESPKRLATLRIGDGSKLHRKSLYLPRPSRYDPARQRHGTPMRGRLQQQTSWSTERNSSSRAKESLRSRDQDIREMLTFRQQLKIFYGQQAQLIRRSCRACSQRRVANRNLPGKRHLHQKIWALLDVQIFPKQRYKPLCTSEQYPEAIVRSMLAKA